MQARAACAVHPHKHSSTDCMQCVRINVVMCGSLRCRAAIHCRDASTAQALLRCQQGVLQQSATRPWRARAGRQQHGQCWSAFIDPQMRSLLWDIACVRTREAGKHAQCAHWYTPHSPCSRWPPACYARCLPACWSVQTQGPAMQAGCLLCVGVCKRLQMYTSCTARTSQRHAS